MRKVIIFPVFLFLLFSSIYAQRRQRTLPFDTSFVRTHYTKHEYMIPMRDGVKLFTAVYTPKDTAKSYPFMMERTCYSVAPYGEDKYPYSLGPSPDFTTEGFIFVYQDVRGKHHSEGNWTEITPFIENKKGAQHDEASDTYDAVDWLIKNIPHNNGKVGVWGISYPGFFATNAALAGHPAIKAVSPQAPVTNWFLGDDTHHNGALFLMDEFDFDYWFANSTNGPNKDKMPPLNAKFSDNYQFYLNMKTVPRANELYYHHLVPFWDTILMHPNYDEWWQARDIRRFMSNVKPATLVVGGFYDAEDQWGAMNTYESIEHKNANNQNTLIMGPWYHGGWASGNMDHLGDIPFGFNTSKWFQKNIQFPFFMHYLKDAPLPHLPEALLYDVGLNQWDSFSEWASKDIVPAKLYFNENNAVTFTPPTATNSYDEYISDPNKPVPYQGGIKADRGVTYMDDDQRFASQRPDVLAFETPVLDSDVTLAGEVAANLYVSVSGTDADFIVKLIDVSPDTASNYRIDNKIVPAGGYQALVRAEVMRGKFRNSFSKPEPFVPNKPTLVKFHVPDVLYTFKKGHKIMLQVQSSWFPLLDMNPQVFEDIYKAKPEDFKKATIRLYHQKDLPSNIQLGILPKDKQHMFEVSN
ncbi:X-Pro dipeptidyl-peptidase [Arachidicoccus ginsenosidimutans]|nr:X-Pro dipeptidyl-peptidase [Arachidicoccus sp. BS20]